jgi:uncharacterized protein YjiS (DUF1127 family)
MSQIKTLTRFSAFGLRAAQVRLWQIAAQWSARRRDRLALARLDPHLLQDIGLDARDAAKECAKPLWRN